jgi:hypothetical protein
MTHAYQRNAADPRQTRYAERKAAQTKTALLVALRAVLETEEGRLVLQTLLTTSRLDLASFSTNGSEMCFNEGQRNVGLRWKALCYEASPELYALMEREAHARDARRDAETQAVHQDAAATTED